MQKLLVVTQKVDENDQLLGFFIDWIRLLAEKFEKITVLCLEKGQFTLPDNVEVISLGKDHGAGKLKILSTLYFLLFTCRKEYDAVFVHMNPIWVVLGGWWWRLTGKKIYFWYTSGGVTLKLKLAEKFSNVIFTASPESFRLKSKKVIVTGHGIDTDLFKPNLRRSDLGETNHKLKILSVGRIAPVKNYETIIEAAEILKDRGFNFSVTMVGEPALDMDKYYELRIKEKIKKLKLESYFNFVGKVDHKDLPPFYQSHDLFVHLSKTGSLDKTILEAMACGMNVLSSNDASRGFLPPELIFNQDNSAELADKIKNIQLSQGRNLRQYVVENHSLSGLIDKIYNECISKTIIVYPFPYSSKSNKYINLLYSRIDGKRYSPNFFRLFWNPTGVIHIHWTNVIYGSRFLSKTVLLMIWNFIVLWLLKIKGFKIVWTKHNYYLHDSKWIWLDKIGQNILFKMADAVTVHQKSEQKNKKIIFIPHGNYIDAYGPVSDKRDDVRNKFGFSQNDIILISVGAIKPYKKIENIVEVFNKTKTGVVKLLIVGKCDKDYAGKLKNFIDNNINIKLDCNFIPDDEMPDYLAAADYSVFWYDNSVLTSGGIILSLSYGVPAVARNISAADLVEDGKNGFLFNNEQELGEIIAKLLTKPRLERNNVVATVKDVSWDGISGEFMKLYKSLWNN